MHRLIAAGTGTGWVDGRPRRRRLHARPRRPRSRAVARARPDVVFLCSPNNPTGTALDLDVVEAVYDAAPGHGRRRRGVRGVLATGRRRSTLLPGRPRLVVTRTMSKAFALAGARRRLPRRRPGGGRRAAAGAAAVPPVGAHPGGRAGGAGARRRAARHGRRRSRPQRDRHRGRAARRWASTWSTPTRTSCSSAGSTTRPRSGRRCSTAGVLVRDVGLAGLAAGHRRHRATR